MNLLIPVAIFGESIGAGEVLLILVVALVFFGSKNLPQIARSLGRAMTEFRRAAREMSDEILHADERPPTKANQLPPAQSKESKDVPDDKTR
jgi:sec-independent protein translocase protein TatA